MAVWITNDITVYFWPFLKSVLQWLKRNTLWLLANFDLALAWPRCLLLTFQWYSDQEHKEELSRHFSQILGNCQLLNEKKIRWVVGQLLFSWSHTINYTVWRGAQSSLIVLWNNMHRSNWQNLDCCFNSNTHARAPFVSSTSYSPSCSCTLIMISFFFFVFFFPTPPLLFIHKFCTQVLYTRATVCVIDACLRVSTYVRMYVAAAILTSLISSDTRTITSLMEKYSADCKRRTPFLLLPPLTISKSLYWHTVSQENSGMQVAREGRVTSSSSSSFSPACFTGVRSI